MKSQVIPTYLVIRFNCSGQKPRERDLCKSQSKSSHHLLVVVAHLFTSLIVIPFVSFQSCSLLNYRTVTCLLTEWWLAHWFSTWEARGPSAEGRETEKHIRLASVLLEYEELWRNVRGACSRCEGLEWCSKEAGCKGRNLQPGRPASRWFLDPWLGWYIELDVVTWREREEELDAFY